MTPATAATTYDVTLPNAGSDEMAAEMLRQMDKPGLFPATRATLLARAAGWDGDATSSHALGELCEMYRRPILVSIQQWPAHAHEAEDLVQEFLLSLIKHKSLGAAWAAVAAEAPVDPASQPPAQQGDAALAQPEPTRSFRAWLKRCLCNFLISKLRERKTLKRGGHLQRISLEDMAGDDCVVEDVKVVMLRFDQEFAESVFRRALTSYETMACGAGEGAENPEFAILKKVLLQPDPNYAELSAQLGKSVGTTRTTVKRFRDGFKEVWDAEVRHTVRNEEEASAEMKMLKSFLATRLNQRKKPAPEPLG